MSEETMFKGIPKEVWAGMVEINENPYSRDILERLVHYQSEGCSLAQIKDDIELMKHAKGEKVDYKQFFDALDRLEELGLIKENYCS